MVDITALLWVILLATTLLYIGYGGVFAYHWIHWSHNAVMTTLAITTYTIAGVILFLLMAGSLAAFSL
jgi:hypothetical protein